MTDTKKSIKKELRDLLDREQDLLKVSEKEIDFIGFNSIYQPWYSNALKLVSLLGQDRLEEFISYYLPTSKKRDYIVSENFTIQDYIMGVNLDSSAENPNHLTAIRVNTQLRILGSLSSRIDSILADVEGSLLANIQDEELEAAKKLVKVNLRAAGAVAGVVLEGHLQRIASNHGIKIRKTNPTISDLNDPLKERGVYDKPRWRKIQLLADIRNYCTHKKEREPTHDEVLDLISGVNDVIKTVH